MFNNLSSKSFISDLIFHETNIYRFCTIAIMMQVQYSWMQMCMFRSVYAGDKCELCEFIQRIRHKCIHLSHGSYRIAKYGNEKRWSKWRWREKKAIQRIAFSISLEPLNSLYKCWIFRTVFFVLFPLFYVSNLYRNMPSPYAVKCIAAKKYITHCIRRQIPLWWINSPGQICRITNIMHIIIGNKILCYLKSQFPWVHLISFEPCFF